MSIKTANNTNKRQKLLDSALSLFVNQGIDATSTASIAKHAGVANGTLFHHFPSKEILVLTLYKTIKQDFATQIETFTFDEKNLKKQVKLIWEQAINWAITNADKQQFCLQVSQYHQLSGQVKTQALTEAFDFLPKLIEFGQQNKIIANYPLALMVDNAHGQFISSTMYLTNNPDLINNTIHREAIFEMFWKALSA
jgi:AcrR family transcriptional regulator